MEKIALVGCLLLTLILISGFGLLIAYNGLVIIPSMFVIPPIFNWMAAVTLAMFEMIFGVIVIGVAS